MRILGFNKKWDKLKNDTFTTFRFERRDADWQLGETVQVVYKPRTRGREVLGIAKIVSKEPRFVPQNDWVLRPRCAQQATNSEAIADGFTSIFTMVAWLNKTYGRERLIDEPMNKLTLQWEDE